LIHSYVALSVLYSEITPILSPQTLMLVENYCNV